MNQYWEDAIFIVKNILKPLSIKPMSPAVNYVNALQERKEQNLESFYNLLKLVCIVLW